MKEAAIYARYIYRASRASIEDQINICKNYAKHYDFVVQPNHIYIDIQSSLMEGTAFNDLMHAIREHQIDVVLIEDFTRLTRENHEAFEMMQEASFSGVEFFSVTDCNQTSLSESKLSLLKAIINEQYIDDRQCKKRRRRVEGYERRISESEEAVVRKFFNMCPGGDPSVLLQALDRLATKKKDRKSSTAERGASRQREEK